MEENTEGLAFKIKDIIFKLYIKLLKAVPLSNTVIFESNPEFSCNTYPVYRYLIDEKHIDEKYKIVWLVSDPEKFSREKPLKNTTYFRFPKDCIKASDRIKYHYLNKTAKGLIYCNRLLGKFREDQFSICLQHGMPLKKSNGSYCIEDHCDACLCVSEFFADNYSEDFRISKDKMIFMGFPRNDYLFGDRDVLSVLGFTGYDKVIIWMPTYRKHTAKTVTAYNIEGTQTGIPAINTEDEIKAVDKWLRENNCLLILKPHPVQNISVDIQSELTNFKVITNDLLAQKDVQLYELMRQTDALVTDYSSVYYDYLLTDKPIGLTVDDLEDYINARGFVYDDPKEILKGEYINDNKELIAFFNDVKNGEDRHLEERTKVKNMMHTYQHGGSAKMIGDYIMEHLK